MVLTRSLAMLAYMIILIITTIVVAAPMVDRTQQRLARRQLTSPSLPKHPIVAAVPSSGSNNAPTESVSPSAKPTQSSTSTLSTVSQSPSPSLSSEKPPAPKPSTTDSAPAPPTFQQPSTPPPATTHSASASSKHTTPSPNTSSTSAGSGVVGNSASATPTGTAGDNLNDDGTVPTHVSEKVLIGLGAVAGLLVIVMGSVALTRRQKKKALAAALVKQTAQFNNNNPYSQLSETSSIGAKSSVVASAAVASGKGKGGMATEGGGGAFGTKGGFSEYPMKPLGTFQVLSTYTPALADEIEIGLGDTVTVLQEYDDGWCLGINNTRGDIQGVFPRHCVDNDQHSAYGAGGYGDHVLGLGPPNVFAGQYATTKRMSSIAPPQGWNQGHHNGYGYSQQQYQYPQLMQSPPYRPPNNNSNSNSSGPRYAGGANLHHGTSINHHGGGYYY